MVLGSMWEAKKIELYFEAAQICICDMGNQNTSILGCDALVKLVFHGGVGEIGDKTIKPDSDEYTILMPRKSWGIWGNPRFPEELWDQYYSRWPSELKDFIYAHDDLVTVDDVRKNQSEYVVTCGFYDLNLLHDLDPEPSSEYIRSQSDPFDEEGMVDRRRLDNWLEHFGISTAEQLHCSGHLSGPEIKELIERAQPDRVVPIHTEVPEHFLEWHDNVEILSKGETISL